jgi:hypothetical protein
MQTFPSASIDKAILILIIVLWTGFAAPASAQQASSPPVGQDVINQQLLQRVQELEKEVQQLKGQPTAAAAAPAPAPAPEPPPAVEAPTVHEVAPRLRFNVFGDVGFEATDKKGVSNTFEIGSMDLFMTARLSDRVSLLGEILFISSSDNTIAPDIERLLLQYKANDHFAFAMGRYHSAIGYYNTAFHQGAWFETAIGRPYMYAFDDEGGFLPLQEVGVTTYGQIPSGKLGLNYVAEVGNGRNHLLEGEPAQNAQDANNGKSINVALFARPSRIQGLEVGVSMYHDYLTFSDNVNHSELITTAHVVFVNSNYEFLNEGMWVRHVGTSTGTPGVFNTPAFYTQFSRRFGPYRPYFRYQYINAGVDEPIYGDPTDGPLVGRRNGPTVGVRYDFNEHAAFKLQYDRLTIRGEGTSNGLDSQFAFTF